MMEAKRLILYHHNMMGSSNLSTPTVVRRGENKNADTMSCLGTAFEVAGSSRYRRAQSDFSVHRGYGDHALLDWD